MNNTAQELDEKAKAYSNQFLLTEGQLLLVLMDMKRNNHFALLNYENIFDYCERRLRFPRSQAHYYKTVAEKSESVPELKEAVVQGELTLSQARRIAPVLTQENSNEWMEKAKKLPQTELERQVTIANPKARVKERLRPVGPDLSELVAGVNFKAEGDLKALKDILSQKTQKPATLGEVVAWSAHVCREKHDPIRKAERSKAVSSGNQKAKKQGRQPIEAAIKHAVTLRDEGQCTWISEDGRRCNQKRWVQFHHVIEVKDGGTNSVENIRLMCSRHHRLIHT